MKYGNKEGLSNSHINGMDKHIADYQPKDNEFAGYEMGKTTEYVSRTEHTQVKQAQDVKKQGHKGKYD